MKLINEDLCEELDNDYNDIRGLLDFQKPKEKVELKKTDETRAKTFDELAASFKAQARAAPVKQEALTEKEQAAQKKAKLLEAE